MSQRYMSANSIQNPRFNQEAVEVNKNYTKEYLAPKHEKKKIKATVEKL